MVAIYCIMVVVFHDMVVINKSSEHICSFLILSRISLAGKSDSLVSDGGVNTTPHPAHLHANIFSRLAQGRDTAQQAWFCVRPETVIQHARVSCLMRSRCGLTCRLFLFRNTFPLCYIPRTVFNNPAIHGQDSLVDWLAVQMLHLCSYHQGEQVSVWCINLLRTSQLRLYLRKWMRDKAWECWLHHCSCRRGK